MHRDPLLIGVDVGTTAAKGAVFDPNGEQLGFAEAHYSMQRPREGWAEQEPEDWFRALLHVLAVLARDVDLARVAAIGICSQVNTHVFVDAGGRPLAPAITWQDQRAAEIASELDDGLDDEERARFWGGDFRIDASFLLTRAAWFARHRANEWRRVRWILSPKDYLNLRLTGEVATDPISPIGLVGQDGGYIAEVLELVEGAARLMPPMREATDRLGTVREEATGLPSTAAVVVGTMDAWGNLYGSGVTEAGDCMEVAGTSEIIGVLSEQRRPVAGVVSFAPVDGLYLHAGPTQAGGDALRWFAETSGLSVEDALTAATQAPPGAGRLIFLPYLAGERAPLWDSEARAVFFGLTTDHRQSELVRAVLEGVAFSARHLLEAVEQAAGCHVAALNTSGGGARSDLWCQIKSDVFGREVRRLRVLHSGVLGAALMAGKGAGLYAGVREAARRVVRIGQVFYPDETLAALYGELYEIYRNLYPALKPAYRRLGRATSAAPGVGVNHLGREAQAPAR
jgi:xylulokinase